MPVHLISQGLFQKLGGVIRDQEKVTDIKPGPLVTVSTSSGVYRAKALVITAGPWANKLLAHTGLQLPLEVFKHFVSWTLYATLNDVLRDIKVFRL